MKNFKKNCIFCATIILSIQNRCYGEGAGVKFATELNKGLDQVSVSLNGLTTKLPDLGANAADKVTTSLNGLKAEAPNVGANAAKTVSKSIDRAVTAGVGIAVGAVCYVAYREVKKGFRWCFPSKEEQLHEQEVSKKLNILKAENELYNSLVAHAREGKNYHGIPDTCEEAAKKYAAVAGFDALGKMIEEFARATNGEALAHCASAK